MKIYRVYVISLHKIAYTLEHFLKKEDAENLLAQQIRTASGPVFGIEEIDVIT